ncbi:MAG: hypothetical protein QM528_04810 [Phycisphaerales bacterium]|nr:hypothetical protein [Phycisphaerales bacterium]
MNYARPKMLLLGTIILYIWAAFFSKGYYHPDEHFQILEFARVKYQSIPTKDLAWEYAAQIRPVLQPLIAIAIHYIDGFLLGSYANPFIDAFVLRLLSALFSLYVLYQLYLLARSKINNPVLLPIFYFFSFFIWFMIYQKVRFSSENWSGNFFFLGLIWYLRRCNKSKWFDFFMIGLLMGLGVVCRMQTLLMVGGFFLWALVMQKEKSPFYWFLILGGGIAIWFGVILDSWYYGHWVCTIWQYFDQNIIQHKAANFGVYPWWYYFTATFIQAVPPFSLFIIAAAIAYLCYYPRSVYTWIALPFIIVHILIGHKELRFLFPLLNILPIVFIFTLEQWVTKFHWHPEQWGWQLVGFLVKLTNGVLIIYLIIFPINTLLNTQEYIYHHKKEVDVIVYDKTSPFYSILEMNYYKPAGLIEIPFRSFNQIDSLQKQYTNIWYATQIPTENKSLKLFYTVFPGWIWKLNFNGWVDRVYMWRLYKIVH